jgi:hypothetical protein
MSISFTVNDNVTTSLRRIKAKLKLLPQEAYKEFVKDTPIRSGHARRSTKLRGNIINANYPYAKRLDEGYSKQSPNGMTAPTEAFIKKRVKQILKGK